MLKHKRTCGDAIKKGLDGGELEMGTEADGGHGSYGITQGNTAAPGRKRGKSKNAGEAGERKRKRASGAMGPPHSQGMEGYSLHDFSTVENHGGGSLSSSSSSLAGAAQLGPSMHGEHGRAPKMAFKKGNRKGMEKNGHATGQPKHDGIELDGMGLLQGPGAKTGPTSSSSNYDDAMQFLKKRRYLHAANNGVGGTGASDYDVSVTHLQPQPTVIQGVVSGVMDGDASLGLLDSHLVDIKPDKSGIPDEVLQSLLDHYAHKSDVTFDLSDPHPGSVEGVDPLGHEEGPPSPGGGDKTAIMHEYSRFLLQALERTSHSSGFSLGSGPGPSPSAAVSFSGPGTLLSDKHVYTTSPLEYPFAQPVSSSSSPSLSSSVPKSHFGLIGGSSPQQGFHVSGLEPPAHSQSQQQQQLTPSQELTEQLEKQHVSPPPPPHTPNANAYQIQPPPADLGSQKELQGPKTGVATTTVGFSLAAVAASQDTLATLDPAKGSYQIENFAQAFGAQFKGGRRPLAFSTDPGGEVEHRIQAPVSEFSGYSSLLADVSDPVSARPKTPPSQSYN